ncbi:MAG: glutaredoxin 3 [Burkholderiaceae bacterium]
MSEVTIYRTSWCPFCQRAEALLAGKSIAQLDVIDIDERPDARPTMIELAGGKTSVPQIFINGAHIGGCDDLHDLERTGELDTMLAG